MPLYEYQCSKCGKTFERIRKFSDPPLTVHDECGGPIERLLSAPSFRLTGSGWYATDYAKTGSKGSSESEGKESGDAKAESKPGDSKASESKSGESKSESKSSEAKSGESKTDSKSADSKPPKSKPAPAPAKSE